MQQYLDDTYKRALADYPYATPGAWVLALPRPDLDPTSKNPAMRADYVQYKINAKENQVAVMHVLGKGKGRVRLGYREHIPVDVGDLVLVNMRETGHWITLHGTTYYLFTGDVPFARMYRTTKPVTAPSQWVGEPDESFRLRRGEWHDEWLWNIRDVLSDYVLLGRDPDAERKMQNGPETRIELTHAGQTDGVRSDDMRDNRFPIVYRRVLGVGPGKWLTRESDLGVVEREETKSEALPGHMMAMCRTVQAASFTFQGCPLEVIHAASVLQHERGPGQLNVDVHDSVAKPLTWTDPDDTEADADPEAAGQAVA